MTTQATAIANAFEAIDIGRNGGFWWCGERADWYPARLLKALSANELHALSLSALTDCLYENFYQCGGVRRLPLGTARIDSALDPIPRSRFASATTGNGSWESGWEIVGGDSRRHVRVRRDGLTLLATPREVRPTGGKHASIKRSKSMHVLSPGFYTALLDAPFEPNSPLIRLYWHVMAGGAEPFIRAATRELNEARIGGSLKVVNDRSHFDRCDSAVMYLSLQAVVRHVDLLVSLHAELSPYLRLETPAMTLRLAHGLAVAQDPGSGLSFGQHRCRLIATAALTRRETEPFDRTTPLRVEEVFGAERISRLQPYCTRESIGTYGRIAGLWNSATTPS